MAKYTVMHRGQPVLHTNHRELARKKLESVGETAYIKYSKDAVRDYQQTHLPLEGELEKNHG
jgi:hypothetical protein